MNTNEQELWVKARDMAFNDMKDKYGFFTAQFKSFLIKKYSKIYDELSNKYFNRLKEKFALEEKEK